MPCHRVVAAGGKVGGFGGEGGEGVGRGSRVGVEEGAKVGEKRRLLREEGVRFDGRGRVVGGGLGGVCGGLGRGLLVC